MADRDVADILTGRMTVSLEDGDLVTDAVLICRISPAEPDGESRVGIAITTGTAWLDQFGLIKAADNILSFAAWRETDEDGDGP